MFVNEIRAFLLFIQIHRTNELSLYDFKYGVSPPHWSQIYFISVTSLPESRYNLCYVLFYYNSFIHCMFCLISLSILFLHCVRSEVSLKRSSGFIFFGNIWVALHIFSFPFFFFLLVFRWSPSYLTCLFKTCAKNLMIEWLTDKQISCGYLYKEK